MPFKNGSNPAQIPKIAKNIPFAALWTSVHQMRKRNADRHRVRQAGAGGWSCVREKYCYLAGGWRDRRGIYCSAGGLLTSRTQ